MGEFTRMQVMNPEIVEIKYVVTFTIGDWKRLIAQIDKKYAYPACDFVTDIREMISKIEKEVYPNNQ